MTYDLIAAARRVVIERGFAPDVPADALAEAAALTNHAAPAPGIADLRALLWSSVDNDDSRDLDQVEVAEQAPGGTLVRVGIADVDAVAPRGSAIDRYAASETTTLYTGVKVFPMLPERLSTDLSSLLEGQDRLALVTEFLVAPDGTMQPGKIYRALLRNRAQLTYADVGGWLEGTAPPPAKLAAWPEMQAQLQLQDAAAQALSAARHRLGALHFDRVELQSEVDNGKVIGIQARKTTRAGRLIEDFMIAANETMAQALNTAGVSSIRRVVKAPERWARIVELAAQKGAKLPDAPDAAALGQFLQQRKAADPAHFPDLSLSVLKLMGSGEYDVVRAGADDPGHFGLAAHDYTHSTAPNRRFADLVTQRLIKASSAGAPPPYTDDELAAIAQNCTRKEDDARKVERDMTKRIAAVAMAPRVGQEFAAFVTGVVPHKGVFVRLVDPPVEGRLMSGEQGLDVGDSVQVRLLRTDPDHGFIDFGR